MILKLQKREIKENNFPVEIYKNKGDIFNMYKLDHERFFTSSPDMLCIAGFDGCFKKVNPSFERILGYTKEELLSRRFLNFVANETAETTSDEFNLWKNGKSSDHFENQLICKDGSVKWISWRSFSVPEEQLIYCIARDITDEKKSALLISEQSGKLKELVTNNKESLQYAKFLQEALFHDPETLSLIFPESFIFHSSKDILSGDFYWFEKIEDQAFVACADCTGHGVPGALLSVLGVNKLHEIISSSEFPPSRILSRLNTVIYKALGKKYSEKKMNDGMDIALYSFDFKTNILNFAGARNPLCIIRKGEMIELEADSQSIGYNLEDSNFSNKTFLLEKGDMLYVFSDGYGDQFGGVNGKKFTRKRFKELLLSIAGDNVQTQKSILEKTLKEWKGINEQTDDICVIGTRIL